MGDRLHRGFGRLRGGGAMATFTVFEADLLRSLAGQVVELLRNERAVVDKEADPLEAMLNFTGPVDPPDDPVLARLLPTAYRDDDDAAAEFRRYTEGDLRDGKAATAGTMIDTLEEAGLGDDVGGDGADPGSVVDLELDAAQALAWLKGLTDLRLALAVRLGIEEDEQAHRLVEDLPQDDPRAHLVAIYEWLGFLQETLVHAVS
ncbi:DUF2017 domain-containing protein [Nocardioides marmoribigeumensis]|uniref:Uncharacterized protein YidB (DUF937 family) n=1 Tax=Nocardioides marmoribigeumensis TaxID=433649 RepID=A0ABU2C0F0_9ACTN|nr:DUF2017 domain-containing protein [Nocardioides marmoribigeumensis]MDR7364131.1 uncharacterized protein YidB (DUF937 family) [Nocardioides marmoribigeumensis]